MWGNAFRNPSRDCLFSHLKCITDDNKNAYCKRSYLYGSDVPESTKDFEELSDNIKEFLSQVPNLYVEDAAVSSGRLLEVRIRSVTNDPATALAMKNLLHRMPQTFTAIGEDPHSRALTVLVSGNASIENIIKVRVIIASNVVGGSESD